MHVNRVYSYTNRMHNRSDSKANMGVRRERVYIGRTTRFLGEQMKFVIIFVYAGVSGLLHSFLRSQKITLERGFLTASLPEVSAFSELKKVSFCIC